MIQIVPLDRVIPLADPPSYFIDKMESVLIKQGQIEPLQVYPFEDNFMVFVEDVYGSEIVFAARRLEWPTLLVTVTNKFEY